MRRVRIVIAVAASVGLLCATALITRNGESSKAAPNNTNITWIGSIVSGVERAGVVGGPFPEADPKVQVGLRGDGVVVRRKKQK